MVRFYNIIMVVVFSAALVLLGMSFKGSQANADEVKATIVRVIDGDTVRVDIKHYPDIIGKNIPIRLAGIDTPELRGKLLPERASARRAKKALERFLPSGAIVTLKNMERGKYYRIVAEIWDRDGNNINEQMDRLMERGAF